MEIKISEKTEQPLLGRMVVSGTLGFEAVTPSMAEVRKKVSDSMKADASLVLVSNIKTDYGQKAAKVIAHIYKTKEALDKFSSEVIRKRNEKVPKNSAKEAPKEDAPKEPKKE